MRLLAFEGPRGWEMRIRDGAGCDSASTVIDDVPVLQYDMLPVGGIPVRIQ